MAPLPAHRVAGLYLAQRVRFGMKFGLETMRALVAEMGHPERACPSLLVAGTNGKGSVAAYCDSVLRASGLRTGRYTSPHLVRVNERIAVDGRAITDGDLARAVRAVRDAADAPRAPRRPRRAPDLLRGADRRRLRALPPEARRRGRPRGGPRRPARRHERVGPRGLRDRQRRLRPRGVPRPHARVDREGEGGRDARRAGDGHRPAAAEERARRGASAARARASSRGARRRGAGDPARRSARERARGRCPGRTSATTCVVAIRLLEEAKRAGLPVDLRRVPRAVARTRWPGRLQRVPGDPPLLLDGAHNPAGARALAAHLAAGPAVRAPLRGDGRQGRARPRARRSSRWRRRSCSPGPAIVARRVARDARPARRPPRPRRPPRAERRPRAPSRPRAWPARGSAGRRSWWRGASTWSARSRRSWSASASARADGRASARRDAPRAGRGSGRASPASPTRPGPRRAAGSGPRGRARTSPGSRCAVLARGDAPAGVLQHGEREAVLGDEPPQLRLVLVRRDGDDGEALAGRARGGAARATASPRRRAGTRSPRS